MCLCASASASAGGPQPPPPVDNPGARRLRGRIVMLQHSARPSANRFKSSLSPIAVLLFLLFCLADGFRPLVPPHTVSTRSPGRVLTFHRSAVAGSVGPTPAPQPRRRILPRLPRLPPAATLAIPLVAALVGYVTNYVGVKMLFYPTAYVGIPLLAQPEGSPLGLLGWQGIVPCKRAYMVEARRPACAPSPSRLSRAREDSKQLARWTSPAWWS